MHHQSSLPPIPPLPSPRVTGQRTPQVALSEFKTIQNNTYSGATRALFRIRNGTGSSSNSTNRNSGSTNNANGGGGDDDTVHDICNCAATTTKRRGQPPPPSCLSTCVNRQLQIECDPSSCPIELLYGAGICQNQRITKHLDFIKHLAIKPCPNRGVGVFCTKSIPKHQFICEYIGEVITERECATRLRHDYVEEKHKYLMCMSRGLVIDATRKGNLARFANHSCDPNCVVEEWHVRGLSRMGIFASRDIDVGEELCFDYNFQRYGEGEQQCYCGAQNCRGILGGDKRQSDGSTRAVTMIGRDPILDDNVGLTMTVSRAKKMARLIITKSRLEEDLQRGQDIFAFLPTNVMDGLHKKFEGDCGFWPGGSQSSCDVQMFR